MRKTMTDYFDIKCPYCDTMNEPTRDYCKACNAAIPRVDRTITSTTPRQVRTTHTYSADSLGHGDDAGEGPKGETQGD